MAETLKELMDLPIDEVIAKHDDVAGRTNPATSYYLGVISWLHQSQQTDSMLGYTKWMTAMTVVILIATIVNVSVAIVSLW